MTSCNHHQQCITNAFERAEEICVQHHVRFTDLRRKVFAIIVQNHQPAKAYDILHQLQKDEPSAKPATIYRSLDFLLENGLIHKLHISNSYVGCSHPLQHPGCFFLICDKCHEVTECCDNGLIDELKKIGHNNHFQIEETAVEIKGICGTCG